MELVVKLGDVVVGTIRTGGDGRNEFGFAGEYLRAARRPVLGQYFEDHLTETHRSRMRLAPFFSNLLPEGPLRDLVARRAEVHPENEAALIALLGEDLPGAVIVRPLSELDVELPVDDEVDHAPDTEPVFRFSLAGAQLKFSVLYRKGGRGPTLPVSGRGGNWIAKLPSETYPGVPENEYAMVRWAGRSGITVPETDLVRVGDIEGLPLKLDPSRGVFLSRRFDRLEDGGRVHQEDFAQVKNVRHNQRYGTLGCGSIARIIYQSAGDADLDEAVRRIAFNVLIGNGDAHLKNWSLIYPDRIGARLSPAYDLVATVVYLPDDTLALKLARENRFEEIRLAHFERLAAFVGVEPARVIGVVRDLVGRAMASWPAGELPGAQERSLRAHVERLPLLREAG